jgi:hypothetical protein
VYPRLASTLAALLFLTATAASAVPGIGPAVRRISHAGAEIEIESPIPDAVAHDVAKALASSGIELSALWNIPGSPLWKLAIINRPPEAKSYGPQLAILRTAAGSVQIRYESVRLFDDDLVHPWFFRVGERLLILADHGSEDAYGVLALAIDGGSVRDLGQIPIARPSGIDAFTRGAASAADVYVASSGYVVRFSGPILLDPAGENERTLAREGEVITYREVRGKLVLTAR